MKKALYIVFLVWVITSCSEDASSNESFAADRMGQGGSTAIFAISNDYLYGVDESHLNVFSISNPSEPVAVSSVYIGFNIETLFAFEQYLFIGSREGMYIYSIENPMEPTYLSQVQHFTACDPVVSNLEYSFVTLHSNSVCGEDLNQLEIYNTQNLLNPFLVRQVQLSQPKGLAIYGDYLWVCDDRLKVFDISQPEANVSLVHSINISNSLDLIIRQNDMFVIATNSLRKYRLNPNSIEDVTLLNTLEF